MVRKILKYDLQSYIRPMVPAALILCSVALLNRIIQFFESDSAVYDIVFGSSVVVLVIASIGLSLFTTALIIIRFYKGMFSKEGYLTLTLPVTTDQHLLAKLLGALIVSAASVLAITFGVMIATSGEYLVELFKAANYLIGDYFSELGAISVPFVILEVLVEMILLPVVSALMFYFCLTVGQKAKSKRVLAAVGVYFIIYFGTQILGTICIVIGSQEFQWVVDFFNWLLESPAHFTHTFFGIVIFCQLLIGTLYYLVIRKIFEKKLNLE